MWHNFCVLFYQNYKWGTPAFIKNKNTKPLKLAQNLQNTQDLFPDRLYALKSDRSNRQSGFRFEAAHWHHVDILFISTSFKNKQEKLRNRTAEREDERHAGQTSPLVVPVSDLSPLNKQNNALFNRQKIHLIVIMITWCTKKPKVIFNKSLKEVVEKNNHSKNVK